MTHDADYESATDVVICARDEQDTISAVIRALIQCPGIGSVIVVDDGSADATRSYAELAGAVVVAGPGRGKTAAMLAGLARVTTPRVLFCDADISGLEPRHVYRLLTGPSGGMITGTRGDMPSPGPLPPMSGERCLPVWLARQALSNARGYEAELVIDAEAGCASVPVATFRMDGVCNPRRMPHTELFLTCLRLLPGLLAYMRSWVLTAFAAWVTGRAAVRHAGTMTTATP